MKVVLKPRLSHEEDIRVCVSNEAIPAIIAEAEELASVLDEDVIVEVTVYPRKEESYG